MPTITPITPVPPTPIVPLDVRPAAELRRLARGTRPDVARDSLKVLAQRQDPSVPRLARALVTGHGDENVRATAAVVLGREPGRATQDALLAALGDSTPAVRRRVVQSLARHGDVKALRAIELLSRNAETPEGRAIETAETLLSYRLGLAEHLVSPERTGLTQYRVTRGAEIDFGSRLRRPRASVEADVARELPGIAIDAKSLVGFVCSGQPGALVFNRALVAGDAATVLRTPIVAGALLRERSCSERYSLDAYLLIDDREATAGASANVWLMRPDGTLLHHGRATATATVVEFTIGDSNPPYGQPVRVSGTFDAARGALAFDVALVGKRRTDAATAANPASRPDGP